MEYATQEDFNRMSKTGAIIVGLPILLSFIAAIMYGSYLLREEILEALYWLPVRNF